MEDIEPVVEGGAICRVGIYTPDGKLVCKAESNHKIYHYAEVIDPNSLQPGTYHVIIQQQEMVLVDKIDV